MKENTSLQHLSDTIISIVLIVVLFVLLNPLHIWMPTSMEMLLIGVFAAICGLFLGVVWREHPQDERDEMHMLFAGRVGFVSGAMVLTVGIIYQSLQHALDYWLPIALVVMIISKVMARMYSRARR